MSILPKAMHRLLHESELKLFCQFHKENFPLKRVQGSCEWHCQILVDLIFAQGTTSVTTLTTSFCGVITNLGTTYLIANPVLHARMKHIKVDYTLSGRGGNGNPAGRWVRGLTRLSR
jgi:hypothetical protein